MREPSLPPTTISFDVNALRALDVELSKLISAGAIPELFAGANVGPGYLLIANDLEGIYIRHNCGRLPERDGATMIWSQECNAATMAEDDWMGVKDRVVGAGEVQEFIPRPQMQAFIVEAVLRGRHLLLVDIGDQRITYNA